MKSLSELSGIGPKTIELLHKLGIETISDLVCYYPKRYNVLKRSDMRCVMDNDRVILDGVVEGKPTMTQVSSKLKKIMFRISNCYNVYNIGVFNQVYLCRELKVGSHVIVIGKYNKLRNMIVASEVRLGKLSDKAEIEPIYATTEGLNQKVLRKFIRLCLENSVQLNDYIPKKFCERYHFLNKLEAISQIHFPDDSMSYKKAKQRLKYEEFFWYLIRIQYIKKCVREEHRAIPRILDDKKIGEFIRKLPFSLTIDQLKTIDNIKVDLLSNRRMNRLVQGDVGCGKTIVAFLACYMNFLSGYQTALMVPTEILAQQHWQNSISLFKNTNMKIVLLTSSISKREKNNILKQIKDGEVQFIIGTQSLIQDNVVYNNLGLIITDEQHRFGVNQREELKNKGVFPDVLSMSATPIPRTYALTIYGDMDVSSIQSKPVGRKEVITYCKDYHQIIEVLQMIKRELLKEHQIYVIAPSIEKNDSDELDSVLKLKEKMKLAFGKLACVEAVHGKLDNEEKNKIMKDFESGKVHILISTTVIEVGVNVPNASMIVIFQANLFGLSTLHQLRGRVGRGDIQSYCILLSKEKCERLEMLEKTNDGFKISEYDFQCRGEGDLFGIRQSGDAQFKLADIKKDFELLLRVKKDVDNFCSNDRLFENYISRYSKFLIK